MRILITEFKRLFKNCRILYFSIITLIYIFTCFLFWEFRFKLDFDYGVNPQFSTGLKLWQDILIKEYFYVLLTVVPGMIYVFSFVDDKKEKVDIRICTQSGNELYYPVKFIVTVIGGMVYNFLVVFTIYFPLYFGLATVTDGIDKMDRVYAYVEATYKGESALVLIATVALEYAFKGGVYAALAFVASDLAESKVIVAIFPYLVFKILQFVFPVFSDVRLIIVIMGEVDSGMYNKFSDIVLHFLWWISLSSIIVYLVRCNKKEERR